MIRTKHGDNVMLHDAIITVLHSTYLSKNKDYGNNFSKLYAEFGMVSPIIKLSDKMERIKSLGEGREPEVKDEKLVDTLLDLANYAIMTAIELALADKAIYNNFVETAATCRKEQTRDMYKSAANAIQSARSSQKFGLTLSQEEREVLNVTSE